MKILVIDNYDSFTFNLVQLLGKYKNELLILKNDEDIGSAKAFQPDKILISPGPGRPENSGLTLATIEEYGNSVPILGVCLGMQAICYLFGAEIINTENIYHGKTSKIIHDSKTIFQNITQEFEAMRYHSLLVEKRSLPQDLEITASTKQGEIMGLKHKTFPIFGVQFHPESILTRPGKKLLKNFLEL